MDEVGKSTKQLFKDKKFIVICIIVGAVALVLWIIKSQRQTTDESTDYYDGTQAIGYGGYGYPYAGGWYTDSEDDYSAFENLLSANDEKWQTLLDDLQNKYDANNEQWQNTVGQMEDKYDALLEKYESLLDGETEETKEEDFWDRINNRVPPERDKIDIQAIIDQMQANGEMWWDVVDEKVRDMLHLENIQLGDLIAAKWDSETGIWYGQDGKPLFTINKGDAIGQAYSEVYGTGTRAPSTGEVSYTQNVDYQAAINKALVDGAPADVVNQLNTQRDAKIAATGNTTANASFDPNTDYQALINKAKASGANQSVIDNLTAQRNAKIAARTSGSSGVRNTRATKN